MFFTKNDFLTPPLLEKCGDCADGVENDISVSPFKLSCSRVSFTTEGGLHCTEAPAEVRE